jgi:hypothetical protein
LKYGAPDGAGGEAGVEEVAKAECGGVTDEGSLRVEDEGIAAFEDGVGR